MSTQPVGQTGWRADDSSFGARLALVRQRMGWGNVAEAALACGQPVSSWRNWERDGRKPRDYEEICRAVSARTGCDLAWLMGATRELGATPPLTSEDVAAEFRCTQPPGEATAFDLPLPREAVPDAA